MQWFSSICHVICTIRTKTEYQEQTDAKAKKKRGKIGLAPVQREGLKYEFHGGDLAVRPRAAQDLGQFAHQYAAIARVFAGDPDPRD